MTPPQLPPQIQQLIGQLQPQQMQIPETVYVLFSAEINVSTAESLIAALSNFVVKGVKNVYLALSTPGGEVPAGLTLYNVLRAMPFDLTIHNVGNVDSIGNAIFLAGTKRYASPHSTFMFHGVGFDIGKQAVRLEEKNLRESLDRVLSDQHRIGAIIEERTHIAGADVEGLFREAQTKDAAYAVSCGIVHEVKEFTIPPGSTVVSLVFKR